MKVINQNADNQLFSKAKSIEERHDSWRCIYMNLARKRRIYSRALIQHFFTTPLVQQLADVEGTIYVCEDGDIFVLFQGNAKAVTSRLAAHFSDQDEDNPFVLLDLSVYWDEFITLCKPRPRHISSRAPVRHLAHLRPPLESKDGEGISSNVL